MSLTESGTPRVALYYRVSQPGQVEAYGYDAQKRLLPAYARQQGWEIVGEYEEPGISGEFLTNRPAMMRLLADAQAGKIDVILVIEDSRLSRGDLAEWQFIKAVCDRHDISLATPSGLFYRPGNEDDDFMTDIRGAMSKAEKKRIMRRMARGKKEALEQGSLIHAQAPFGYRFVHYGKQRSEKRLEIVPEQAEVVRLIFDLAIYGVDGSGPLGVVRLAYHLNEVLRLPGPRSARWGRDRQAVEGAWSYVTIGNILRNEVYRGAWHFGKRDTTQDRYDRRGKLLTRSWGPRREREEWLTVADPEIIPPLVTDEVWEAAQEALNRRGRGGRKPVDGDRALLSGFLRCPHCGYAFAHYAPTHTTKAGEAKVYRRYVCLGRDYAKRFGIERCDNRRWKAEELESVVWEKIRAVVKSPDLLRSIVEAADTGAPPPAAEAPLLEKNLAALAVAEDRIKSAFRAGVYSLDELEAELRKVRQDREALEERRAGLARQVTERAAWERSVSAAVDLCQEYQPVIDDLSAAQRRGFLDDLVSEITVSRDGEVSIDLIFDARTQARVGEASLPTPETKSRNGFGICKSAPLAVCLRAAVGAPG